MSGDVGVEAPRPRPLSGGLWTLFSWLRRDERSSSESLSSVGSDRTVASFAFLGPGNFAAPTPVILPPLGPPTDSYKKRVRDRNLRRQHDRDITIHRKYGLYGYDAFSLPNGRRAVSGTPIDRCERDRRATSESLQRRAHVPGKRRAPLPPACTATVPRRRARKRPAPQPPINITQKPTQIKTSELKIKKQMDTPHFSDKQPSQNKDNATDCKTEKYSKKDSHSKESKPRQEKSFLKQIFENKKRNSAIDTSSIKLLPNISELDKQAAEIIEKYKLKEVESYNSQDKNSQEMTPGSSKEESWICTRCLKKYNATVVTCSYCLPLSKSIVTNLNRHSNSFTQTNSSFNNSSKKSREALEEKEKLKEILKEMKNSLPKKNVTLNNKLDGTEKPNTGHDDYTSVIEAPTLRIGSTIEHQNDSAQLPIKDKSDSSEPSPNSSNIKNLQNVKPLSTFENVVITKPVVLEHTSNNIISIESKPLKNSSTEGKPSLNINETKIILNAEPVKKNELKSSVNEVKNDINKPLKISSLLNPIYIKPSTSNVLLKNVQETDKITVNNSAVPSTSKTHDKSTKNNQLQIETKDTSSKDKSETNNKVIGSIGSDEKLAPVKIEDKVILKPAFVTIKNNVNTASEIVAKFDQHSRRRDLINQLEQSIAKGDERAAAEAAVKLAQLKLSCSVLSFSSQIMAEASTSSDKNVPNIKTTSSTATELQPPTTNSTTNTNKTTTATQVANYSVDKPKENNNSNKDLLTNPVRVSLTKPLPSLASPKVKLVLSKSSDDNKTPRQGSPNLSAPSTSQCSTLKNNENEDVPILVWVEDKEATRGPVQLHVRRNAVMSELRKQAEKSLGLPTRMQRWIIGRTLCTDDNTLLGTLAGPDMSAPFYLCLVESETKEAPKTQVEERNVYNELMKLEQMALVLNTEMFECGVCMDECPPGSGIILRECVHSFCKECLSDVVRHCEEPVVSCPATSCRGILQEREVRGLVSPEDYEKWLARSLAVAESGTRNAFHCRTRDCSGWALCEPGVRRFPCPVCKHTNCVPCQAIHEGLTCEQHQVKLQESTSNVDSNQTDDGTRSLINTLISRGEAVECPECSAIITKKWGCDWVKCSACKTEICWVTRGRRWGAGGRGDTSGGCKCGVDGKKCHPSCGYCH